MGFEGDDTRISRRGEVVLEGKQLSGARRPLFPHICHTVTGPFQCAVLSLDVRVYISMIAIVIKRNSQPQSCRPEDGLESNKRSPHSQHPGNALEN